MASGQIYRGKVTRASAAGVWIMISSHWPGVEFGPCDIVATAVRLPAATTSVASSPDPHQHTLAAKTLVADFIKTGDDVLVLSTAPADFLVVGTIRTGVSATGGL